MTTITDEAVLRGRYRAPGERALRKQLDHLDRHCRRFIELSPFAVLGSASVEGPADVSPRGGAPGFVRALDEHTLASPDSPGNNRLDTLANLMANPEVALLFLIPGVDEVLRVNGRASVESDEALLESLRVGARPPATVILVRVREAYLHCAKAVMRARLWQDDARVDRAVLPTMNQMIKDQTGDPGPPESQEDMVARYRQILY